MTPDPDQDLLRRLRALHDVIDPVPEPIAEAARAAFAWREIDAELAALTSDTIPADAGMRSSAGARLLAFTGPRGGLEAEVVAVGRHRRLVGQLLPVHSVEVAAEVGPVRRVSSADVVGCFRFDDLPPGPLRLRWTTPEGPVATAWVLI